MVGVNQVIMIALPITVVAGLIGPEGLGGQLTSPIGVLNLGLGIEAGLLAVTMNLNRFAASLEHASGRHQLALVAPQTQRS